MEVDLDGRLHVSLADDELDLADVIREELTVDNPRYLLVRRLRKRRLRRVPRNYKLARGKGGRLHLPRGYLPRLRALAADRGMPLTVRSDKRAGGATSTFTFHGTLRPYQEDAVTAAWDAGDGVVCAPTGAGKTVIALGLVARCATRSLILVHTTALLHQTAARAREFLGCEPGLLGDGRERVRPLTIAMVQTLLRRPTNFLADEFGLVILDEAHHCPASTFRKVIQRFTARRRVGLTATPERRDGLHPMMYATLGPLAYTVASAELRDHGALCGLEVATVETPFEHGDATDYNALLEALTSDPARNEVVVEATAENHRARTLVLTDRVDHAHLLCDDLNATGRLRAACLTGAVPGAERAELVAAIAAGTIDALVATTSLIGEGFDCPPLDMLVLATPTGNGPRLTQMVGRILRPFPGKPTPLVIDVFDRRVAALRRQRRARKKVYAFHLPAGAAAEAKA